MVPVGKERHGAHVVIVVEALGRSLVVGMSLVVCMCLVVGMFLVVDVGSVVVTGVLVLAAHFACVECRC